ncbi:MAG TPA: hypothetical protein DD417_02610, partial [Elusimicrobia bacterium]|nr:hypothetical protein [Elusimicrobiota bacterium]
MEFLYRFSFPNGTLKLFHIVVDDDTLSLQLRPRDRQPDWTRLGFEQCTHCPLDEGEHPYCPAASALVEVVEQFKDCRSSQAVDIEIRTQSHTYTKRGPLSLGMSSLVAVCMPTCGCPVLDKLRPMVYTHLPFATLQQNLHRQLATYMLAQHFRARRKLKPDWEMKGLVGLSEDVRTVNRCFCQRLTAACPNDATVNALVHLD